VGGNGANGGSVILQTNCMHVDDINTDFITNELWVDNDISHTYWTEAGVYVGTGSSGGIFNTTAPQYYWADKRPNGLYVEHDSGTGYTYGSQTTARVSAVPGTPTSWSASVGPWSGTSTSNFSAPSHSMQTGTESTNNNSHSYGASTSLTYLNTTGSWVGGWTASSGSSSVYKQPSNNNLNVSWAAGNTYHSLNDGQGVQC
jgi:hypothetical protein